ncbi:MULTISPECIES: ABC transporter substrate-binding protein [Pseudonocardia]|uniref:Thiamine pyrimidine synthase n=2 Tax=Pseudonocardia TaxID=1847 RepID=A0A1Y2MTG7_PSEAH|nr:MULTISPECIES: ABC transporter substrate-binding protein [Pseudonocardia]OSY38503.1 putative thiamine biosynthesis protein [Pseudonocardia autotrophica]TDN77054.1 ABC-type nitrate/sulfonate/bicarbonate transport system substrate-binding protein [Pseudonocardia autotrophica]BBG01060.1 hypothetical protein Pdca_22690 [Pseudonocardia autotrophica]GEC26688.1 hypothetical protein PSA01_37170 [Pseudonocardia saturnea]
MSGTLSRRQLLRRGLTLGGAALLAPAALSACVSGTDGPAGSTDGLGVASQRLAWLMNAQFVGSYVAEDRGYYREEGFSGSEIVSGGPTAAPIESDVLERTFAGVSQVPIVGAAVAQGAPLKIVGAVYQRYAGCIVSMADSPIRSLEDLRGKTIGCSSSSEPVWRNFLASMDLNDQQISTVPVQGDPIAMTTGEFDGYLGFLNNQPIDLRVKGFDVETMLLADVGFRLPGQTYIVKQEDLDAEPEKVKAFLRAEIRGWNDALADPEMALDITLNNYGAGLGLDPEATAEALRVQTELIRSTDGAQHVGLLTDAQARESAAAVTRGGLDVSAETLFDLGPITEIYAEEPALRVA